MGGNSKPSSSDAWNLLTCAEVTKECFAHKAICDCGSQHLLREVQQGISMLHDWSNLADCKYAICPNQLKIAFWLVGFLEVAEVWEMESWLLAVIWCCFILEIFYGVLIMGGQRLRRNLSTSKGHKHGPTTTMLIQHVSEQASSLCRCRSSVMTPGRCCAVAHLTRKQGLVASITCMYAVPCTSVVPQDSNVPTQLGNPDTAICHALKSFDLNTSSLNSFSVRCDASCHFTQITR